MPEAERNQTVGSWAIRRRFMFVVTAFCMATIGYVLGHDMRSRVAETAVASSFLVLGSTIASYVFGATWDDHNARRDKSRRRRSSVRPSLPGESGRLL